MTNNRKFDKCKTSNFSYPRVILLQLDICMGKIDLFDYPALYFDLFWLNLYRCIQGEGFVCPGPPGFQFLV